MSEGLNRVMLLGNLGADPDLKFGQGGPETAVLKLRIATTESYFDKRSNERKERTDWHNVVLFGRRAEALQRLLAKGSSVFIEGRLQPRSYEKDGAKLYTTEVVATNVVLAGGRGDGAAREERPAPAPAPAAAPRAGGFGRRPDTPQQQDFGDDPDF